MLSLIGAGCQTRAHYIALNIAYVNFSTLRNVAVPLAVSTPKNVHLPQVMSAHKLTVRCMYVTPMALIGCAAGQHLDEGNGKGDLVCGLCRAPGCCEQPRKQSAILGPSDSIGLIWRAGLGCCWLSDVSGPSNYLIGI
jgi:hypothetical protein